MFSGHARVLVKPICSIIYVFSKQGVIMFIKKMGFRIINIGINYGPLTFCFCVPSGHSDEEYDPSIKAFPYQ